MKALPTRFNLADSISFDSFRNASTQMSAIWHIIQSGVRNVAPPTPLSHHSLWPQQLQPVHDICHLIWRWRWSLPQLIVIKIEWAEHRHTSLSTAMVSRCRTTHHSVHDGHHTNMCMIRHGLHHTSCSKGTARLELSRACKVFVRSSWCQSIKRNKRRHRSYLAVTSRSPRTQSLKTVGHDKLFKVAVADPIKA